MEVYKDYPPTDFIREKIKFLDGELPVLPSMFRTEITIEVANVCYLYITAVNQFYLLF